MLAKALAAASVDSFSSDEDGPPSPRASPTPWERTWLAARAQWTAGAAPVQAPLSRVQRLAARQVIADGVGVPGVKIPLGVVVRLLEEGWVS